MTQRSQTGVPPGDLNAPRPLRRLSPPPEGITVTSAQGGGRTGTCATTSNRGAARAPGRGLERPPTDPSSLNYRTIRQKCRQ